MDFIIFDSITKAAVAWPCEVASFPHILQKCFVVTDVVWNFACFILAHLENYLAFEDVAMRCKFVEELLEFPPHICAYH